MFDESPYYVVAPINGLHLDFDYRMYSAEVYGCPPNYTPHPEACPEFRQPYEYLGSFTFDQYVYLSEEWKIDGQSLSLVSHMGKRKLRDYCCIAFQVSLDKPDYILKENEEINETLFKYIIDKGERFLDVWRLCLFKPGEDLSIGSFGTIGNGVQCFWIGQNDGAPKFIARRTSRYQLVQEPIDVLLSEFGPIHSDQTFRGLSVAAFYYPSNKEEILDRLSDALRAFRESRDLQILEARFRHLAAIAESLAKKNSKERLKGDELRDRIAKIAANGWEIYENYNSSRLTTYLAPEQYRLIRKRYNELGWSDKDETKDVIKDLWDNVRNPLSHTVSTFITLKRDPIKDLKNIERVIVTMINGINAAYEVKELHDAPLYDILLKED